MENIFISYNREDEDKSKALFDDMQELGHTVWFDQELSGGQKWWDTILKSIRNCDIFVFVLSVESLNSLACRLEYGYAFELGKTILPILVGEGVSTNLLPPELSQVQFLDYQKRDRDTALHLAKTLATIPPSKSLPNPLPSPPEVPISYLGSLIKQIESVSNLNYKTQSVLVVDLKRSLRDPENSDDARTLLNRLRKRRDLFATIADEIDELLESTKQAATPPAEASKKKDTVTEQPQKQETLSAQVENEHMDWKERVIGAIIGAILGIIFTAIVLLIIYDYHDLNEVTLYLEDAFFPSAAGIITGALSGKRRLVIVSALIGAVVGFFFFGIFEAAYAGIDYEPSISVPEIPFIYESFVARAFFGAPFGAIIGAIVGVILRKRAISKHSSGKK